MGFFSGITNALFGGGGAGTAGEAVGIARDYASKSVFQPFTVTTGAGTAGYDPSTGFTSQLSPEMQAALSGSLTGAQDVLSAFRGFSPEERAQELVSQQVSMLQPEFERLFSQQATSGFRSGTLGKRMAGQSLGLGEDIGLVNVGDVATQRIISQALAPIAANAQTQALSEYGTLANLSQGLLSGALNITGQEQALLGLGGQLEGMRGASYLGAGNLAISPMLAQAQIQQQQRGQNAGFLGGILSAGATEGGFLTTLSDVTLKTNIEHVDTLPNGIKLYTWDWNDEAKNNNLDHHPKFGVLAQEIQPVIPEAVVKGEDGYLRVNYNHPELQGVH